MSTLNIDVVTDATAAAAELDQVASAARGAGDAVDAAGAKASSAGSDFDGLADGSDNVASKSSQAAGALGDLGGGLEAVGLTGAGAALEGVGMGAQFAAGAGDAMNLVADTTIGKFVLQTAAAIGHRTATIAGAIATGTMTAAQTALNVVMSANPILLVVIALAALAAGLIFAYKHSETFRNIVDGAFSRAKEVVDDAAAAVAAIIGWFQDLPGVASAAWTSVKNSVSGFATGAAQDVRDFITGIGPAALSVVENVAGHFADMFAPVASAKKAVSDFIDGIGPAASGIVSTVAGHFSAMFAPINTAIGWVQDLIDAIGNIHFPSLPDNPFSGRAITSSSGPSAPTPAPSTSVSIVVNGAIDPVATARQIRAILSRYDAAFAGA